jgi:MFS family permease
MDSYRSLISVIVCLSILQAALGALAIVGPLTLLDSGVSTLWIGLVASSYAGGFLLGAQLAPREIGRIGHIRSVSAFGACAAVAAALLSLSTAIPWWLVVQFGLGVAVAMLMATGESWIADAAPEAQRGSIVSVYMVVGKLGYLTGPLLVQALPQGAVYGFLLIVALMAACLVPVAATDRSPPEVSSTQAMGPRQLWARAPAAAITALVSGLCGAAVLQLYSVYISAIRPGDAVSFAALFNAALIAGSVLLQWPAGLLSDRTDRRLVIGGLGAVAGLASLGLASFGAMVPSWLLLGGAALWGAGAMSIYAVAVAHAADRAGPGEGAAMMSGVILVWAFGMMVGPTFGGVVMDLAGPSGLFAITAIALIGLAAAMLLRRADRAAVDPDAKGDFAVTTPTSFALSEMNAMADESDDQWASNSSGLNEDHKN